MCDFHKHIMPTDHFLVCATCIEPHTQHIVSLFQHNCFYMDNSVSSFATALCPRPVCVIRVLVTYLGRDYWLKYLSIIKLM
uniref:Uncharacterized protein n=1 Tax=Pyxicephalus adspersus TaxID=30357 RepID=A0AAV3ASU4_PYXAD|nr:TPA: hypothetical protein GDO54_010082 [Pyxicephalus adspersus]